MNFAWYNRDTRKEATERVNNKHTKKIRKPTHEDLNEALLKRFIQQVSLNIPVRDPILKLKMDITRYQCFQSIHKTSHHYATNINHIIYTHIYTTTDIHSGLSLLTSVDNVLQICWERKHLVKAWTNWQSTDWIFG